MEGEKGTDKLQSCHVSLLESVKNREEKGKKEARREKYN